MRTGISFKKAILAALFLFILPRSVFAVDSKDYQSGFGLRLSPGADFPIGESSVYFSTGVIAGLNALFTPVELSPFIFTGSFDFVRNARDEQQKEIEDLKRRITELE